MRRLQEARTRLELAFGILTVFTLWLLFISYSKTQGWSLALFITLLALLQNTNVEKAPTKEVLRDYLLWAYVWTFVVFFMGACIIRDIS